MTETNAAAEADETMDAALRAAIAPLQVRAERTLVLLGETWQGAAPLPEAMNYAVLGGGKRLRPVITMAASLAAGGTLEDAERLGGALELVHAYSLVHDDLPAMDDDTERRGKPTVHVAYGEANAILVGDALLTHAFEAIADAPLNAETRIAAVRTLAQAAGAAGMVGGQVRDIAMSSPDESSLLRMHAEKTGALFVAACKLGATAAQASNEVREALIAFGHAFGTAFQIGDDLVDALEPTEDAHEANVNLAVVLGTEVAHQRVLQHCVTAREALERLPGSTSVLNVLVDWVAHRAGDAVARAAQ